MNESLAAAKEISFNISEGFYFFLDGKGFFAIAVIRFNAVC